MPIVGMSGSDEGYKNAFSLLCRLFPLYMAFVTPFENCIEDLPVCVWPGKDGFSATSHLKNYCCVGARRLVKQVWLLSQWPRMQLLVSKALGVDD